MRAFHPLTVKEVRRETDEAVSVAFAVPDALKADYAYAPGQFLTLKTEIAGEETRRSYSLCSGLDDGEWRVAIKKVDGGRFSTFANEALRPGDVIDVLPPDGRFVAEPAAGAARHVVLIAAGSGITPMLAIAKSLLGREAETRVSLIYGNRTVASILFRDALADLKSRYLDRFAVYHVLSREPQDSPLLSGRIDADKLEGFLGALVPPDAVDDWYICGPLPMIDMARAVLAKHGVARRHVHFELFTDGFGRPLGASGPPPAPETAPEGGPRSAITIRLDGVTSRFDLARGGPSILDAALTVRPDLPFACKGGVCCTCRAKVTEGEVEMAVNYGLEPDEVAQGFVLTCQARPLSETVALDYDAR